MSVTIRDSQKPGSPIEYELGQLRHLYTILKNGRTNDPARLADGLLSPVIQNLERKYP